MHKEVRTPCTLPLDPPLNVPCMSFVRSWWWRRTRTSDLRKYNEHILANHNAQISTEIVQNFK